MSRSFYTNYKHRQYMNKTIRKMTNRHLRRNISDCIILPDGSLYKKISAEISPKNNFNKANVGQDVYTKETHRRNKQQKNNITCRGKKLVDRKVFNKFKHRQEIKRYNKKIKNYIENIEE